ncbi:MAG: hypothetical protein FE037_02695 [Thermoplasmata archaeon]|nr:MAG: hypothetical protein FE042_03790 [Thermoplasmata archaeon]KAA0014931.1 MAG: hypothetical protein FE037_02695 [Thermoplasmata archaeon]
MVYAIFEIKKEDSRKIDEVLKDDLVSRQSITTRDASSLDIDKDVVYVKIEGSEEGIKRAEELFKEFSAKKLGEKEAEEINKKMEAQDESAALGLGNVFG